MYTLTIIGKNLDFIYSTNIIPDFWNYKSIEEYPFFNPDNEEHISFRPVERIEPHIHSKIRERGNLVFINIDT